MITNHNFLEMLKAVCLSVDWVPKLIKKNFPTMEQKLVQLCETEIVVDACNNSYGKWMFMLKKKDIMAPMTPKFS